MQVQAIHHHPTQARRQRIPRPASVARLEYAYVGRSVERVGQIRVDHQVVYRNVRKTAADVRVGLSEIRGF
jgi:hypothetical protein